MGAKLWAAAVVLLASAVRAQPTEAPQAPQVAPTAPAPPAPSSTTPVPPPDAAPPLPPAYAAPPQPMPAGCVPECRVGFVCVASQCVSACNPPCPADHVCDAAGRICTPPPAPSLEQAIAEHEAAKHAATVRRHDGFYLRAGINAGYAIDTAEIGDFTTKSKGAGGFIEYAIGGTLIGGLVLAFGHHTFGVFSPHTTVDGVELTEDHTDFFQVIGPLVDYYIDTRKGLHFTATVGFGTADINVDDDENTDTGFGLAVGGGYDVWIGEQWSIGFGARLLYVGGASEDFGEHRAFIPTGTFSVLLH